MNEVKVWDAEYFEQIRNLCKACGLSIDKIARQFNINQNLVAKLFMETMQTILSEVDK
jgi:transcriptional regulator with XRE-family HTH domain